MDFFRKMGPVTYSARASIEENCLFWTSWNIYDSKNYQKQLQNMDQTRPQVADKGSLHQ